jgi:hypothetical protein
MTSPFNTIYEQLLSEMELENPVTNSDNFKKWFDESKIKYGNGEPMAVFHGTNNDSFSEVDDESDTKYPNKLGFWFAISRDGAGVQGDNVMSIYAKMNNPKLITQKKWDIIREKYSNYKDYWIKLRKQLMDKGYDGIFIPKQNYDSGEFSTDNAKIMAVFTSNQIKSSIDNNGDYDIDNMDIYK